MPCTTTISMLCQPAEARHLIGCGQRDGSRRSLERPLCFDGDQRPWGRQLSARRVARGMICQESFNRLQQSKITRGMANQVIAMACLPSPRSAHPRSRGGRRQRRLQRGLAGVRRMRGPTSPTIGNTNTPATSIPCPLPRCGPFSLHASKVTTASRNRDAEKTWPGWGMHGGQQLRTPSRPFSDLVAPVPQRHEVEASHCSFQVTTGVGNERPTGPLSTYHS